MEIFRILMLFTYFQDQHFSVIPFATYEVLLVRTIVAGILFHREIIHWCLTIYQSNLNSDQKPNWIEFLEIHVFVYSQWLYKQSGCFCVTFPLFSTSALPLFSTFALDAIVIISQNNVLLSFRCCLFHFWFMSFLCWNRNRWWKTW